MVAAQTHITYVYISSKAAESVWWEKGNALYGRQKYMCECELEEERARIQRERGEEKHRFRLFCFRFGFFATRMASDLVSQLRPLEDIDESTFDPPGIVNRMPLAVSQKNFSFSLSEILAKEVISFLFRESGRFRRVESLQNSYDFV